jgi:hypothetical protein
MAQALSCVGVHRWLISHLFMPHHMQLRHDAIYKLLESADSVDWQHVHVAHQLIDGRPTLTHTHNSWDSAAALSSADVASRCCACCFQLLLLLKALLVLGWGVDRGGLGFVMGVQQVQPGVDRRQGARSSGDGACMLQVEHMHVNTQPLHVCMRATPTTCSLIAQRLT